MNKLKKVVQLIIAFLFILSGVLKAMDSQTFSVLLKSYLAWNAFGYIAPFLSGIEVLLGLFLLLNIHKKTTSLIISILTIVFTIAFGYAFFVKGIEDCGCMGSLVAIPPLISFARNIFIISGAFWIWKTEADKPIEIITSKKWIILIVGCLTFLLAGFTLGKKMIDKNNIHKGDQLSTQLFRFFDKRTFNGKTIIFIFSPTCGHCWDATANVKTIKEIPEYNNVIGLTFDGLDVSEYVAAMQPNFEIINYPTNELSDFVKEVPVLLILNNGKVERIFNSHEIPCGKMLQRMLNE